MDYCKYHPISPATYLCESCKTTTCDSCVDYFTQHNSELCFNCGTQLNSLGAVNNAEPFWRKLDQSFKYPVKSQPLTLIIGVSVLTSILMFIPFTFIWQILLTGCFVKYCFSCLAEKLGDNCFNVPILAETD
jgi:hypothetical protein